MCMDAGCLCVFLEDWAVLLFFLVIVISSLVVVVVVHISAEGLIVTNNA